MLGGYLEGVWSLSGRCVEAGLRVWKECLEDVGRLSGGCGEDICRGWRVWGGYLVGLGMLSGGSGKAVWRMW